ncbi:MAG: hypothetical protein KIT47_01675 [Rhodoferax sp.]|nr:hypothetical protein [Rhodoferax sp.]
MAGVVGLQQACRGDCGRRAKAQPAQAGDVATRLGQRGLESGVVVAAGTRFRVARQGRARGADAWHRCRAVDAGGGAARLVFTLGRTQVGAARAALLHRMGQLMREQAAAGRALHRVRVDTRAEHDVLADGECACRHLPGRLRGR